MKTPSTLSRREFIKLSIAGSTGLIIGFNLSACGEKNPTQNMSDGFKPSIYLQISPENVVTIFLTESEMGQGIWTSLPMLIAEELELDWRTIQIKHAPTQPEFGTQYTGGSNSVRKAWQPLREAGAIAREMLILAGAVNWHVPVTECVAESGSVIHKPSGKHANYGELALAAAELPIPENVHLKNPRDYQIIGTNIPQMDGPAKIHGAAIFGSDVKLDNMLIATIVHCPVFGGALKRLNDKRARKIKGVHHIIALDDGVAVVADNYWIAQKGRAALDIEWDVGINTDISSKTIRERYESAVADPAVTVKDRGQPADIQNHTGRIVRANYEAPFQAHATMEPMCCVAHIHEGKCDIWAPTQAPSEAQNTAAHYLMSRPERVLEKLKGKLTGEGLKDIQIHTTFLGCGFGRRVEQDFIAETVQIARAIDKPVKLIWSREEDIQHDFYRPYTYHQISAGLDSDGIPSYWKHRIVGPARYISAGFAAGFDYSFSRYQLDYVEEPYPVPTGFWRSVSCSQNVFVSESFIDELAATVSRDPYEYRRELLAGVPRLQAVLDLAVDKAGWKKTLPENHFHGLAINHSHGSYVAHIVELSVKDKIRVHRVICVIDCGQVINPDTVRAQMEGSIVFGLTACIKSSITIKNGRVQQSNFHDFPLLRIDEMPEIETHIIPSQEPPGGVGEPGVPPVAPAVSNAVYAATGIRVRKLPIKAEDLS